MHIRRTRPQLVTGLSALDLFARLRWIDGSPLLSHIEPYRRKLFELFEQLDEFGRFIYNLLLAGRSKKNWKTADLVLKVLHCTVGDPAPGYDAECSLLANDKDQSADDLALAKKIKGESVP